MSAIPFFITLLCLGQTPTEGPKAEAPANEASLKVLQQRVEMTQVTLSKEAGRKARLVEKPVFRYSDELRQIEDAGVWLWTDRGRPVAAMKVERYQTGRFPIPWLYCFASLSSELVDAKWTDAKPFQARQPGVKWQAISDDPATTRPARLVQMREIARRFSAELLRDRSGADRTQMRLLSRPLFRCDETPDVLDGAVFGFTGTGTNPDVLLLLDLPPKEGWRFGIAGMTAEGVGVKLKETVVADFPHTAGQGNVFDNWCNFHPNK